MYITSQFFFHNLQFLINIFYFSAESIESDEAEFGRMLKKKAEDGGKCKVISVAKVESEIEVKEIVTLSKILYVPIVDSIIYLNEFSCLFTFFDVFFSSILIADVLAALKEKFPGLKHVRIPVCNSASPLEKDFDTLCSALLGTNVNAPVIVNCQVSSLCFKI